MSIENHPNFFAAKFIVELTRMKYEGFDEEKLGEVYRECMRHQLAKDNCPFFDDIMSKYGNDIREIVEQVDCVNDNLVEIIANIEEEVDCAVRKAQNER